MYTSRAQKEYGIPFKIFLGTGIATSLIVWVFGLVTLMGYLPPKKQPQQVFVPMDWDIFLYALAKVESNHNSWSLGAAGEVGEYQIRQCVVDDLNQFASAGYSHDMALDPMVSRRMCTDYIWLWSRRGGYEPSWETFARIWNGGPRGPRKSCTLPYWRKVHRGMLAEHARRMRELRANIPRDEPFPW